MQFPQADTSKSKRVGVDEQFIKFQSSLTPKVMKKYIQSKINSTEPSNRSSPNNPPDPPPPPSLDMAVKIKPEVQISLNNLEPSTSELSVTTKVEKEYEGNSTDLEQPSTSSEDFSDFNQDKDSESGKTSPSSNIMCRDFIRGTCNRPGTCRYKHKCDTTQLIRVYTFCRNFQNKVCTMPNCKYVHATIFQEQEFYRTGKLPAQVLVTKPPVQPMPPLPQQMPSPSQLMQPPPLPQQMLSSTQLMPPPPLPPPRPNIPTSFNNPPPPLPVMPVSVQAGSSTMLECHQANAPEPIMYPAPYPEPSCSTHGELDTSSPPKKCKYCDLTLLRLQYHEDLVEKRRKSLSEWKRKNAELDKKKEKMGAIAAELLKLSSDSVEVNPNEPSTSNNNPMMSSAMMANAILTNNMISNSMMNPNMMNNDHAKGPMNSDYNVAMLLANLLREEPPHAGGMSRPE